MRSMRIAIALLCALLFTACKDEPSYTAGGPEVIDRSKLCMDGGAQLDTATNACACPQGRTWNGIRCDAPPATTTAPSSSTTEAAPAALTPLPEVPRGSSTDGGRESASIGVEPTAVTPATPATPDAAGQSLAERLKAACRRAHGEWSEKDVYCHCSRDEVLVGARCRSLSGSVTDDVCQRALSKGKWKSGACLCEPGLVFSPARGGCVEPFKGDSAVLRRVCESSLNKGRWDPSYMRCQCPAGRIWNDELCQVQQRMASKAVCESDFNEGQWDAERKRCSCPAGLTWLDQACSPLANVKPAAACASETNRGTWNAKTSRCICPGLTKWIDSAKVCR